ncbi:MAG: protein kinase [Parachlamydiaceae bacterium]|nr:protein kinase [Parachlamydiaceae bacterium]
MDSNIGHFNRDEVNPNPVVSPSKEKANSELSNLVKDALIESTPIVQTKKSHSIEIEIQIFDNPHVGSEKISKNAIALACSSSILESLNNSYIHNSTSPSPGPSSFETDRKWIEELVTNQFQKSMKDFAADFNGDYIKFSRRHMSKDPTNLSGLDGLSNLSHSYFLTPEGGLIQQLHKSAGDLPHHLKDAQEVVKGRGGVKTANAMADEAGDISHVRAVVHRKDANIDIAIAASKDEEFKSENLLTGHYVTYRSAKTSEIKRAFLTPYIKEGSLDNKVFSIEKARDKIFNTAVDLEIVHDSGWAHLDIKPDNIFGDHLADFDLAEDFNQPYKNRAIVRGTPGYQSPEMLNRKCYNEEQCKKADMFALGITMFEIIGFSIPDTIYKKVVVSGMTKQEATNVFNQEMKKFDYPMIYDQFAKFITKFDQQHLTEKDNEYLDIAWNLINPEPKARLNIDKITDAFDDNPSSSDDDSSTSSSNSSASSSDYSGYSDSESIDRESDRFF